MKSFYLVAHVVMFDDMRKHCFILTTVPGTLSNIFIFLFQLHHICQKFATNIIMDYVSILIWSTNFIHQVPSWMQKPMYSSIKQQLLIEERNPWHWLVPGASCKQSPNRTILISYRQLRSILTTFVIKVLYVVAMCSVMKHNYPHQSNVRYKNTIYTKHNECRWIVGRIKHKEKMKTSDFSSRSIQCKFIAFVVHSRRS